MGSDVRHSPLIRGERFSLPHSGEGFHSVIPAKAGIHFDLRFTRRPREGGDPATSLFLARVALTRRSSLLVSVRLPGGRVTFFACTKKVTKEMHPRLRAGGEAAGSLRSTGFGGRAPALSPNARHPWRAPRAVHAAVSGRPPPLHRGTQGQELKAKSFCGRSRAFLCSTRVPSRSRRAGGGKARRVARRMRASLPTVHGRTAGKPRRLLA